MNSQFLVHVAILSPFLNSTYTINMSRITQIVSLQ